MKNTTEASRDRRAVNLTDATREPSAAPELPIYPTLLSLFEGDRERLAAVRRALATTRQNLERAARRAARSEAERAMRAAGACDLTLRVLDELEKSSGADGSV